MADAPTFADRIQARYPEGLTGLFAIGGTRTTYILEHNRGKEDPGRIEDLSAFTSFLLQRYFDFTQTFFGLGGRNTIITALGVELFYRSEQYVEFISRSTLALISDDAIKQYRVQSADPYFLGVEPLLLLPEGNPAHALGRRLRDFQASWAYDTSRNKIVWEIASIPLYVLWNAHNVMGTDASVALAETVTGHSNLYSISEALYTYYSRAAYGVEMPKPHFYLGTNRNGDLKLRSVLPSIFMSESSCRLYFTPYPSLMMTREAMQAMLEDLAFGEQKLRSRQMDYKDKYTPELAEAEYQRFRRLADDPSSLLGLTRSTGVGEDPD